MNIIERQWKSFIQFFERLFGRRDSRPGGTDVQPPVTDPVPPVVVAPPVVTPEPPAIPPVAARPRLRQLHIWCESADGTRFDSLLGSIGWPSDRVYVHVNDRKDMRPSRRGKNVMALHCLYEPWASAPADLTGRLSEMCRRAKAQGYYAVSLDHEVWTIMSGPALLRSMSIIARSFGLGFIDVPKVGFEHLLVARSDNWAWTRPPPKANMTPQAVCAFVGENSDATLQWYYGPSADTFIDSRDYIEDLGYVGNMLPLMEGAGRITDTTAAEMTHKLWAEFGSIGLFNPQVIRTKHLAALRTIKDAP